MGNILYYLHTNSGMNSTKSSLLYNHTQNLEKRTYKDKFLDTNSLTEVPSIYET